MARTNGYSRTNGFELPPSSMLATHVRPGAAVPHLNQQSFAQLLEESLGQDEDGRPNLGDDAELNQKLILVVLQVGVDPTLTTDKDNPFRSKRSTGRGISQLKQCIAVSHLAITRTRHLLHRIVLEDARETDSIPLYSYLYPKLLSVVAQFQDLELTKAVFDTVAAGLQDENCDDLNTTSVLKDFLHSCFAGFLNVAARCQGRSLNDETKIEAADFVFSRSAKPDFLTNVNLRFSIPNIGSLLYLACQLATFLSATEVSKAKSLYLRKQTIKLQSIVDDLHAVSEEKAEIEGLRVGISGISMISSSQMQSFSTVSDADEWLDSDRARKRPRLSTDIDDASLKLFSEHMASELTLLLTGRRSSDLDGLRVTAPAKFKSLRTQEQQQCLRALSRAACQLYLSTAEQDLECPVCDGATSQIHISGLPTASNDELVRTLLALRPYLQQDEHLRLLGLSAYCRVLAHVNTPELLRLKGTSAGNWCLQAIRSSSRAIRLTACRVLQAYVRHGSGRDTSLLHENRVAALEFLQALWNDGEAALQEAVILALAQMAQVVGEDELNLILLRLVEYLGHQNAYLAGLVYSTLQQVAQHLQVPMPYLFRPFWRTLSVVIIRNFAKRPAIAQQMSDLIGVQVDGLLQIIEEHALPYLVLSRDYAMLDRICASSGSSLTPFELCTKPNNLPKILSFLLIQGFTDPEHSIMGLLTGVSDDFKDHDLAGWLNHDPIQVACGLLESIGDAGQAKASKMYQGLQLLAQLQGRRSGHSLSKRNEITATFITSNILAIVTNFIAKFNDNTIKETNVEKRRCLIALGEVVKLGKGRVGFALPQICACLHAALEDDNLCNTAFSAWVQMMSHIGEDEIRERMNQTFAIISRNWDKLNNRMQDEAYHLIERLLKDHEAVIREIYSMLPSLASIPIMAKFESDIAKLKRQRDERNQIAAFILRLKEENLIVAEQALQELSALLRDKHDFLQKSILKEQPEMFVPELTRAILDACVKFSTSTNLLLHGGQCLGAIGCLDPSKVESIRDKKRFILLSNFANADETTGFLMFFMEQVLVKEYVSTSNLREKGFLAWSLQKLLDICELPVDIASKVRVGGMSTKDRQWLDLSDTTRLVLTPFLTSKFVSAGKRQKANTTYPFYKPGMTHRHWLTEITLDLLNRGSGNNVDIIFDICARLVVYGQGTSISSFLLPYATVNLLLGGTDQDKKDLLTEIGWMLQQQLTGLDIEQQDQIRFCSQSIFEILDYMSLWLQDTRKLSSAAKARIDRGIKDPALDRILSQTKTIESVIGQIPPQVITQKAIECKSYARALFHQEQFVMNQADPCDADFRRLQDIYAQIDEPDGIEGFSAQMKFLDVESEVMEHKKAGRWSAAQSWYEMQLIDQPDNLDIQMNLMRCLKESGQHDVLIHHFDGITSRSELLDSNLLPFAIEAAWVTDRWDKLSQYSTDAPRGNFAVSLGRIMLLIKNDDIAGASAILDQMFQAGASELTPNSTTSFHASHEPRLKMHILDDVRILVAAKPNERESTLDSITRRLSILGSNVADKQYVLGIQRAVMHLKPSVYKRTDIADFWMTSAKLARKAQATQQAFNAVLRGSVLGDKSAAIEQAKLMWQEGDHRKAIQTLEGAIESGAFGAHVSLADGDSMTVDTTAQEERNDMSAKAFVLLGKWLDQAGQTQSEVIIKTFRKSTEQNRRWEKGWYNLGHHYNKILESEKLKPPGKESQPFLTGEAAKLVIDNFLRALVSGNKYMFQTLPKVLTLWLDLVGGKEIEHDARRGNSQFHLHNATQRKKVIEETNATVKKYLERIQPYALYTILPQLVARICHSNQNINTLLQLMIIKVVRAFPQQALWTVLATVKSASKDRATRGLGLIRKAAENAKKDLKIFNASEMRDFITASQKFADELLRIADFHIEGRVAKVSLARDFNFNHKIAPSKLVVPSEACLIPNIPSNNEMAANKNFRAFAKEPVTISAFLDEARVLPSLQKPRKLSLRGSDGRIYSVLAKPHDDLRKDQRLMEFNTMINRFLKHDIDAAKRRLYIKTYAVIPLNEECGLIEWVDGLTTMRDILLKLYDQRGVKPDYASVRDALDKICAKSEDKAKDFIEQVQSRFPPVLRQWFIENFSDPTAWFNARIRYTRTSAVMSMVGHVLGLGDRHGENILFEEGTGGVLHVDFNCLFDKGLTFEKPECVPFRLTCNMRDAMGSYKHEGPFRRCCEITTSLLRSNEDALMTILETFLYDPTTDFQTAGKKRKPAGGYAGGVEVPDTPERMLEGVRGKVRGMLPGESVPLNVGGYVDYMVRQAKDEANLARMYIGWCAFF